MTNYVFKGYDGEQGSLETKIAELQSEIDVWDANVERSDKFIELVKRYTDFDELTNQMVNEFIEKIVVHEAVRINGKREQQVDVYLNFIGNFTAPIMDIPPSAKEIAEREEAERLRLEKIEIAKAKQRERNRKYREQMSDEKRKEYQANRRRKYAEIRKSTKPYTPRNKSESDTA